MRLKMKKTRMMMRNFGSISVFYEFSWDFILAF